MRLIYFGTAEFAVPALRRMAEHVVLVVSQPDRPKGRGHHLQASPVKLAALELGLPVETPEKCRAPEFVAVLQSLKADALLVAAYGQILSQAVLDSARCGGINLHGSILPKYRGAAPIQRAIQSGDTETGVTLMQMDKGMDTGDAIAIETLGIGSEETAGELTPRLADLAAAMAEDWMPKIVAGAYSRTPQNPEEATYAPKVEKAEAEIILTNPAKTEFNRYRAFTPAPGAFMKTSVGVLKIRRAKPAEGTGAQGTVLSVSPELVVACGEDALSLVEVQPEGKKAMSGRDFANGAHLRPGTNLIASSETHE